jgi:hypothetical protein
MKSSKLNTKNTKRKGAAMVLAITAIAIVGLEMHVLSSGANTMLYQSDRAYLEASERNLVMSGLAWAKQNIQNNNTYNFQKSIELNVSNLNISNSSLIVNISSPTNEKPQAQIRVSCSRSRRTLKSDEIYQIKR